MIGRKHYTVLIVNIVNQISILLHLHKWRKQTFTWYVLTNTCISRLPESDEVLRSIEIRNDRNTSKTQTYGQKRLHKVKNADISFSNSCLSFIKTYMYMIKCAVSFVSVAVFKLQNKDLTVITKYWNFLYNLDHISCIICYLTEFIKSSNIPMPLCLLLLL